MDILRCVLAGVSSLVVGIVLLAFGAVITAIFVLPHGNPIGIDLVRLAKLPIAWIIALLLFAVGFIGEYRRSV
ncbi:MAG TPA: hypothetical protein VFM21_08665 [Terriglobia bacterium]|nr:hypothetical protein [Terriglobia bacterium]